MSRLAVDLFTGSHETKIDAKGRVASPADFRKLLDLKTFNGLVCTPSLVGPYLDCGGLDFLARQQGFIDQLDPYDPDRDDLEIALMGRLRKLNFDADGRFIIPKPFRKFANLEGEATFLGRGDYFQIWESGALRARFDAAQSIPREKLARLKSPMAARAASPDGEAR